jgi:spermidine/putrescine transport system ATP-binding protein
LLCGKFITALTPDQRPTHSVFQSYALFPHMTAAKNIVFALHMVNIAKPDIDLMVRKILEDTQLPDRINYYPDELSWGFRRVYPAA